MKKKNLISPQCSNYFVSLDVRYQIETLFNRRDIQLSLSNWSKDTNEIKSNIIADITDSDLYKQNITESDVLSYNFSTDGAQLFKSAKKPLWPLQLYLNCLSGKGRFKYPIIVALWQTEMEPTAKFMDLYLSVLKKQCDDLSTNGIEVTVYEIGKKLVKKLVPFCCCVDTVARPILQNRIQFNGYYGCSWCYHLGQYANGSMRYPLLEKDPEERTHEIHLQHMNEAIELQKKSVFGIKGNCILLDFKNFDIVWICLQITCMEV